MSRKIFKKTGLASKRQPDFVLQGHPAKVSGWVEKGNSTAGAEQWKKLQENEWQYGLEVAVSLSWAVRD